MILMLLLIQKTLIFNLTLKLHASNIIKKASTKLEFFKPTFHNNHALKLLYLSLVCSQLKHTNQMWQTDSTISNTEFFSNA